MSGLDFGPAPGIPDPEAGVVGAAAADTAADTAAAARDLAPRITNPLAKRGEDEFDRTLRPRTLKDFVGQRRVREQLRVFIDAARGRDEALDHALFAGPPGLGKCVTPDTLLFTPYGLVPIGEFGDLHGESWQPITRPLAGLYGVRTADYFYNNGEGSTLRITTDSGYRVEGTPNHPLLVRDHEGRLQFRRLSELTHGDEVAVRLGAAVFGSATKLHIEGLKPPSLHDPAVLPGELTPELARLLGLLLDSARLSPGGDGVVITSRFDDRLDEVRELFHEVFCLQIDAFGEGPLGRRIGQRSPRVAAMLVALGLTRQGFQQLPAPVYRAPRLLVAEFLRGVFWGTEENPYVQAHERTIVAHLQLMLGNFGIESRFAPSDNGYLLKVAAEPSRFESYDFAASVTADIDRHGTHGEYDAGDGFDVQPTLTTGTYNSGSRAMETLVASDGSLGFGVTPAGVLVALGNATAGSDIARRAAAEMQASSVSVAEVEPAERGRALTRERLMTSDVRALAVRSVTSTLRESEIVELVWEPVTSIEPGTAHTCDVSVPDGHTFIGNGIVCHNTTLASVVANELGSTMHQTSGPALDKKADVAAILTSLGPRDVLFIDEIHRLNTAVEEVLYSAMEDYQIDIVLGQGPAARTLRLDIEPFTLVGATTRTGLLTKPMRDRFGLIQRLEYYDHDELAAIVLRSAKLLGVEVDAAAAGEIASRSRGTPRIANRLLKRVRDVAQVRHDGGTVTTEIAREALDLVDIDRAGLDRLDRAILEAILMKFGGGPVGLSTLSISIGEDSNTLEDVYEPYLLQRGLIQRTPRGRIITEHGRAHIGASPASAAGVDPLF